MTILVTQLALAREYPINSKCNDCFNGKETGR